MEYTFNYNELSRGTKKYWRKYKVDGMPCALSNDGQLFMFAVVDVAEQLAKYPKGREGWYFNASRDRRIAELVSDEHVTVNPQFVYTNFKPIYEEG